MTTAFCLVTYSQSLNLCSDISSSLSDWNPTRAVLRTFTCSLIKRAFCQLSFLASNKMNFINTVALLQSYRPKHLRPSQIHIVLSNLNYSSSFPPTLSPLLCLQQLCYFQVCNVYLTLFPPNITGLSYFVNISYSVSSTLSIFTIGQMILLLRYKLITSFVRPFSWL